MVLEFYFEYLILDFEFLFQFVDVVTCVWKNVSQVLTGKYIYRLTPTSLSFIVHSLLFFDYARYYMWP